MGAPYNDLDDVSILWPFVAMGFITLVVPIYFVLGHYVSYRKLPLYATITSFFGWYLSFAILLLVPLDISSTAYRKCAEEQNAFSDAFDSKQEADRCHRPLFYVPGTYIDYFWGFLYWTSFILCWVVYPLMQNYSTAGDFTPSEKFKTTVRENAWFYVCCAAAGITFFIIYVIFTGNANPLPTFMALGNAWGLLLLIAFLGYGLVAIPRMLWQFSSPKTAFERYCFALVKARDDLRCAEEDYEDTLRIVQEYDRIVDRRDVFRKFVDAIISEIPLTQYSNVPKGNPVKLDPDEDVGYDKLTSLHYKVMFYSHNLTMCKTTYKSITKKAFDAEDVIKASSSNEKIILWTARQPRVSNIFSLLEWVCHVVLRGPVLKTLAVVLGVLSGITLWSECVFFVNKPVLSVFALAVRGTTDTDFLFLFITMGLLTFILACAYWGLFQLKLFSYYRLIPGKQTDANSILFSALYLSRIAAPLALNFIRMTKVSGSSFQKVMASMERAPFLGQALFNNYAPLCLMILCVAFFFDIPRRVLSFCGIDWFSDPAFDRAKASEGRSILEKERRLWISGNRLDEVPGAAEPVEVVVVPNENKPGVLGRLKSMFFKQAPSDKQSTKTQKNTKNNRFEVVVDEKDDTGEPDIYDNYGLKDEGEKYFFSSWSHKK